MALRSRAIPIRSWLAERQRVTTPRIDEIVLNEEREERLQTIASRAAIVLLAMAVALILGILVSWVITRRLTRLAGQATAPMDSPDGLPGPFDDRGKDEIGALARALNDMRGKALDLLAATETKDAARRRWIAQVSHDLRTPLTALLACLERVTEQAGSLSPDDPRRGPLIDRLRLARADATRVSDLAEACSRSRAWMPRSRWPWSPCPR